MRRRPCRSLFVLLVAVLLAQAASAATFLVTKTADTNDGACTAADCSLREAVIAANALAGVDTITVPEGNYVLTLAGAPENDAASGDLDINESVVINGGGQVTTTIDANGIEHIFHLPAAGSGSLTVTDMILREASDSAIDSVSTGDIVIDDVTFVANTGSDGGAIFVLQTAADGSNLTIFESRFEGNRSEDEGGAIWYDTSTGSVIIDDSTFVNNSAAGDGGAIEFIPPNRPSLRQFTITDSTFTGNTLDVGGGEGGAIYLCCSTVLLTITGSTFEGNVADQGGGALYTCCSSDPTAPAAVIENSTFSGNSTRNFEGGAIDAEGAVTLTNVTIANNSAPIGGGVNSDGGVEVVMKNTLLANNATENCGGFEIQSSGGNVSSDASCTAFFTGTSDRNSASVLLGPLADNGGATRTHMPQPGSAAIDNGVDCPPPATDQRGMPRPVGPRCDSGSVEAPAAAAATANLSLTKSDTPDPVAVGGTLTYTIVVANAGPDPATGVTVTDNLPAAATFISASSTAGTCTRAGTTVTCAIGTLANGASATVTIAVSPTTEGTLTNTASATATETDPVPANNAASSVTTVVAAPAEAEAIPALEWPQLGALAMILALAGLIAVKRSS